MRLYGRALKPEEIKALGGGARLAWLLAKPAEHRSDTDKEELYKGWLAEIDSAFQAATTLLTGLEKESNEIKTRGSITHVMHERDEPPVAYVLFRGEYTQRKDKVTPTTPEAFPPMPADFPRNRLGFAKWLVDRRSPTTARVIVNRIWQAYFGQGLRAIQAAYPDWFVGIRQDGVVMGLEFDHPQGAKLVMKHLYENGVWAIFSTLDPRVLQYKPGILQGPELVDETLDRTEVSIGQALAELRRGRVPAGVA